MSTEAQKLYFCKRCRNSYPVIVDEKNQEKIKTFIQPCYDEKGARIYQEIPKSDGSKALVLKTKEVTLRFLTCSHAQNIIEHPVSYGNESRLIDSSPDPQHLRDVNVKVTLEFLKANEEQRANMIQFHATQYQMLQRAAKEEKYILQVLNDECQKYIDKMGIQNGEEEKKRLQQKFDHVWRKPEKKLEVLAKDKERSDNKVLREKNVKEKKEKKLDTQMEALRAMMRKLPGSTS